MRQSLQRGIAVLGILAVALAVALPAQAKEGAEKKAAAAKDHQFTGVVTALDTAAGTLSVKNKKDIAKDFTCDKAVLGDVKVNDKVVVKFVEKDGKNVAQKVTLAGEAQPKKEKKEKKEEKK